MTKVHCVFQRTAFLWEQRPKGAEKAPCFSSDFADKPDPVLLGYRTFLFHRPVPQPMAKDLPFQPARGGTGIDPPKGNVAHWQ